MQLQLLITSHLIHMVNAPIILTLDVKATVNRLLSSHNLIMLNLQRHIGTFSESRRLPEHFIGSSDSLLTKHLNESLSLSNAIVVCSFSGIIIQTYLRLVLHLTILAIINLQ